MRCKEIENHVLGLGLDPVNVRFAKGQQVRWFVSVKRYTSGESCDVVVHNSDGRAFVFFGCTYAEKIERADYPISEHDGGAVGAEFVRLGHYTCTRYEDYDVPKKEGECT